MSCTCANGEQGTETCGSTSCECALSSGSPDKWQRHRGGMRRRATRERRPPTAAKVKGPGNHDGAAPSSLYGACAVKGGFGWPCTVSNALDPTNCTDPNYPFCFGGGQGFWCTRACTTANFETACNVEDAGCQSSACNAKGYCK